MEAKAPSLFQSHLDRRLFLRSAVATIALPSLEAVAEETPSSDPKTARNFVAIGAYFGWHQNAFSPKETGAAYTTPPTLEPIAAHRNQFTIFSGLDHRALNGHEAWINFLSGKSPGRISLDQQIADQIGAAFEPPLSPGLRREGSGGDGKANSWQ